MTSAREPGAGAAVTGLFLGSLAIAGAVALVTAPITPRMALAQTVAGPSDRPIAAPSCWTAGAIPSTACPPAIGETPSATDAPEEQPRPRSPVVP